MGNVSVSKKGVRETYASISPSESQEQIIGGAKAEVHVTSSMGGLPGVEGHDDLDLQGIKVTTDVHVVRV